MNVNDLFSATVLTFRGLWCKVMALDGKIYDAQLANKFKLESKSASPVCVGDEVRCALKTDFAVIEQIEARKNCVTRRHIHNPNHKHIIAANVDAAIIMLTIRQPRTPLGFVDRLLVELEAFNIPAALIFNKIDLLRPKDFDRLKILKKIYEPINYPCFEISALQKSDSLNSLKGYLDGQKTLILGNSGVGKSTLINRLCPSAKQAVNTISRYNEKGKHTTTFAQLFPLENQGFIIDTPGLRQFGLSDISPNHIAHGFREFFDLISQCKYHNCSHSHEPDCAVIEAVQTGNIHLNRYKNYLSNLGFCRAGAVSLEHCFAKIKI